MTSERALIDEGAPLAIPRRERYFESMDPSPSTSEVELERLRRELGDQYAVVRLIGRGGMGAVYLARELSLDRVVALKVLPASADDEVTRERFRREARMVARLSHPGIVPLYAYGETERTLYYAMAYIDGETLTQRLKREGPLSGPETRELLASVAAALDHAHRRGLIHRDIKPSNILIDGETGRILVTDFGIGRALGAVEDVEAIGTPQYMAPEQATGSPVDARTDLYALGLTAYEAVAGHRPFVGRNAQAVLAKKLMDDFEPLATSNPDVDPELATLVDQCLATDPDARPATAERVLALLADDPPPSVAGLNAVAGGGSGRRPLSARGWWAMGLGVLGLAAAGMWGWDVFGGPQRIEVIPAEAVTLYSRALLYVDVGRFDDAREALRSVLTMVPTFREAHELLDELNESAFSDADVPLLIARLREGIFSGGFDEAEALLDEVLAASEVSRARKVQVLRHAARDFVQGDAPDRARRAVDHMLDLEPPLVMLHPAVEPPELVEIYGAARRARPITTLVALDPDSIVVSMGPIAVTGLTDPASEGLGEGVAVMVATELAQAVRMVDRDGIAALADELTGRDARGGQGIAGFEGAPDYETAVNQADRFYETYEAAMVGTLGSIIPETHIVYGSVGVSGDRVLVGLWAVSVDEATLVGFAQAEGGMPDGLYGALQRASRTLMEGWGLGR